ncbi:MAG: ATP-dependent DNA helicase RecG [Anaerolineae bacterium]
MTNSLEKLHKILNLEEEQGFANKAVIGGLDKFASFWEPETLAECRAPSDQQRVHQIADLLKTYPTLQDLKDRKETIAQARALAQSIGTSLEGKEEPAGTEIEGETPQSSDAQNIIEIREAPRKPSLQKPGRAPEKSAPVSEKPRRSQSGLEAPVTRLPGISVGYARRLTKLGVQTIRDLLFLFPRRYEDYTALRTISELQYGQEVTIIGNVWDVKSHQSRSGMPIITCVVADATGTIEAVWFNQPYLTKTLRPGRQIVLSGKVDQFLGRLRLISPAWEPLDKELIHTARLVPVYPLTKGISAKWLRRLIKTAIDYWAERIGDPLPANVRQRLGLMDMEQALRQIHFPDNWDILEKARKRLVFDEFLIMQLRLLLMKRTWQDRPGRPLQVRPEWIDRFTKALPFQLTGAQRRALEEISTDLAQTRPMSRLLQGDVGSGKTVVAAGALLVAVANGTQAAVMAPTEILAEQHHRNLTRLFEESRLEQVVGLDRPIRLGLLTGRLSNAEREERYQELNEGRVDIVIGTHALIQEGVAFRDLSLAVIDEQHRFGVAQRATLRQKGYNPHVLVMSATPIPRSLALTLYGDLDISTIDEMPSGRREIKTYWLLPQERERAYQFIRRQVEEGRQAFIIYPLIEESEAIQAKAAVDEFEKLQREVFPDLCLGLLHGRMKSAEKEEVMLAFQSGQMDILVSTSVVEVGIDIPNATVMLIEGAERFGLAQLHQFRGRVGRGEHQSYCLLVGEPTSEEAQERLTAIARTQDGFVLAEKDLELRGPGDFFGLRQSGMPDLRVARLGDLKTLELAREEAQNILQQDRNLHHPEHEMLRERVGEIQEVDLS